MSLILGIDGEPNPAVMRTHRRAINASREILFPGESLTIIEMTPNGESALLVLADDWDAVLERTEDPSSSRWRIRIINRAETTPVIMRLFATFRIGEKRFKATGNAELDGRLKIWTVTAEAV